MGVRSSAPSGRPSRTSSNRPSPTHAAALGGIARAKLSASTLAGRARRRSSLVREQKKKQRHANAMAALPLAVRSLEKSIALQWADLVAVTALVVLHMLYPTILEVSGNLLVCETVDYGRLGTRSVLVADRSIDCDSAEYAQLRVWAFVHLLGYGIGLPLAVIGLTYAIAAVSMGGSRDDARRLFFFITGGYADSRWFWESVVLARKAAVVIVAFAVQDPKLRVYASIWVLLAAFALNAIVRPYEVALLYRLETTSLLTISLSLNLSLLFDFIDEDAAPGYFYLVMTGIFIVNAIIILLFVYGMAVASREKLLALARRHPRIFLFVSRWFEESVTSMEDAVNDLHEQRAALQARIAQLLPRTAIIEAAAALRLEQQQELPARYPASAAIQLRRTTDTARSVLPAAIRVPERLRAALAQYDTVLRTEAVRIDRLPDQVLEVAAWYSLERRILQAELDVARAELREYDLCKAYLFDQ